MRVAIQFNSELHKFILLFVVGLLASCGGSSGTTDLESVSSMKSYHNGYTERSIKRFDASGKLKYQGDYSLDGEVREITAVYSGEINHEVTYFYNEHSQIVKERRIESNLNESYERVWTYNASGLPDSGTIDWSLDDKTYHAYNWEYDLSGNIKRYEYDRYSDGSVDRAVTFEWSNSQMTAKIIEESDGSRDTYTYLYNDDQPMFYAREFDEDTNGTIEFTRQYEYDQAGNFKRTEIYNSEGAFLGHFETEYIETSDRSIPNVELFYWATQK